MCQPIVMMLVSPFHRELTSTIGPGSRKRRVLPTGKSLFLYLGMLALEAFDGSRESALLRRVDAHAPSSGELLEVAHGRAPVRRIVMLGEQTRDELVPLPVRRERLPLRDPFAPVERGEAVELGIERIEIVNEVAVFLEEKLDARLEHRVEQHAGRGTHA